MEYGGSSINTKGRKLEVFFLKEEHSTVTVQLDDLIVCMSVARLGNSLLIMYCMLYILGERVWCVLIRMSILPVYADISLYPKVCWVPISTISWVIICISLYCSKQVT